MNENTARQKGFIYTGVSSRNPEEVKARLEQEFRKQGYKAYFVTTPHNPLSRGYGGSYYSIYAEPKYGQDKHAESLRKTMSYFDAQMEQLRAEYESKKAQLEKDHAARAQWLTEHGYKI